jgi:hypothetical protein
MGHFTISLPNNVKGDVRWGKVMKKGTHFFNLFLPWKKINREEKTGYIIKVDPAVENRAEYRFFKTKEGNWSQDVEGIKQLESETEIAIRKAIEAHEHLNK